MRDYLKTFAAGLGAVGAAIGLFGLLVWILNTPFLMYTVIGLFLCIVIFILGSIIRNPRNFIF